MKKHEKFSVKKRIKSFSYAYNGIRNMLQNEHNAKIHVTATIFIVVLGAFFKIEPAQWALIAVVAGLVFISELFNTAIEQLADIAYPELSSKIGLVKDYAAGAVLISATVSVIVAGFIFIPVIIEWIKK